MVLEITALVDVPSVFSGSNFSVFGVVMLNVTDNWVSEIFNAGGNVAGVPVPTVPS